MLKKIVLTSAVCAVFAGCAASGPTFNAYTHRGADGSIIHEVDCRGLFGSENICMKHAKHICGNQPVELLQRGEEFGTTRHATNAQTVPDTRQLLFRCGEPEHAKPAHAAAPVVAAPVPVLAAQHLTLAGDVSFDTNQATLKPAARNALDALIARSHGETFRQVTVNGYTDSRGSARLNQGLSERRAEGVMGYLREHGLHAQRYDAIGYGKAHPVASNATRAGRARNRRVEITLD